MKRQSMVVPALVALFAAVAFTASHAQPAQPAATPATAPSMASATPAKTTAPAKTETRSKKSASTSAKSASHTSSASKSATPMLDINSASKEELAKLPTIGDALADKIIAARPYKSRKELVSKGVLTQKEYDKVHTHLTAKHS